MWQPKEGSSKKVEPLKSDFWKPTTRGDALLGVLDAVKPTRFDKDRANFSRVVIWPSEGQPQAFGHMSLSLNSWLEKLITPALIGKAIAVRYQGTKDTPNGAMKTFQVLEMSSSELDDAIKSSRDGGKFPDVDPDTEHDDGGDDDLPF